MSRKSSRICFRHGCDYDSCCATFSLCFVFFDKRLHNIGSSPYCTIVVVWTTIYGSYVMCDLIVWETSRGSAQREGWRDIMHQFWNKPYSAFLFSPGELGDCTKHWQRKSGRQGIRAAKPYRNSRLSDQPPEEGARTDPFEMCSAFWAVGETTIIDPSSLANHPRPPCHHPS